LYSASQLPHLHSFLSTLPPPPTSTLFPYTTLFRSNRELREIRNMSEEVNQNHAGLMQQLLQELGREIQSLDRQLSTIAQNNNQSDRKSTRLNSSHVSISYAVFCLKKKKKNVNISYY